MNELKSCIYQTNEKIGEAGFEVKIIPVQGEDNDAENISYGDKNEDDK